jgi:hypothetical protein
VENLAGARESHWTDEQRQAALAELERRYQTRLTEQEVFQAAALFLGLLREGVFIEKEAVALRVRDEGMLSVDTATETVRRKP